jgi:hypothetical protein
MKRLLRRVDEGSSVHPRRRPTRARTLPSASRLFEEAKEPR